MCSPEEEGLQLCCALLRSLCSQFSEGWPSSGPHAGAQGACVRARSGACCGVSCAAGLLAPLPAIFWPGCGYACRWPLEPAPLRWYSMHVASAGFVSSVPACPPVQAVEQWCPMASLNMREPLLSFKDLQGHELLTFSSLLWRRYMEPEPLLSHLRL